MSTPYNILNSEHECRIYYKGRGHHNSKISQNNDNVNEMDNIAPEALKFTINVSVPSLAHLLNRIWSKECIP